MHYAQAGNYLWPQHQRIANYHYVSLLHLSSARVLFLQIKGKLQTR
jgi:hypothetical protein